MKLIGQSLFLAALAAFPSAAQADPTTALPPFTIAARDTFDAFDIPSGSDPGTALLNKVQISATLRGEKLGLNGWLLHAASEPEPLSAWPSL